MALADEGVEPRGPAAALAVLIQAASDAPEDPAAILALADGCRELGGATSNRAMLANARAHYGRRVELGGSEEETYWALYQSGQLAERLGDWPAAMEDYLAAWDLRPARLEACQRLTAGLRERQLYQPAHRFARLAADLVPLPCPDDGLGVTPWVYEWGMLFEYSITAYWVGDHAASVAACRRLLTVSGLPEPHRDQTKANLRFATREERRSRDRARPRRRARRISQVGSPTRGRSSDARGYRSTAAEALVDRAAGVLGLAADALAGSIARAASSGSPLVLEVEALGQRVTLPPQAGALAALVSALEDPVSLSVPGLGSAASIVTDGGIAGIPALLLANLYPHAHVLALEPDPAAADAAGANLAALGDRVEVRLAAGHDFAAEPEIDLMRIERGATTAEVVAALGPWVHGIARISAVPAEESAAVEVREALAGLGLEVDMLDGPRALGRHPETGRA